MVWDKMSILYRGPSIDASYQVSVHLAEGFQRHICNSIQIFFSSESPQPNGIFSSVIRKITLV
jgi:hypothetical protein